MAGETDAATVAVPFASPNRAEPQRARCYAEGMRAGVSHIFFGVLLLGAGLAVTMMSDKVYWWGAIAVGIIEIVRGIVIALRAQG